MGIIKLGFLLMNFKFFCNFSNIERKIMQNNPFWLKKITNLPSSSLNLNNFTNKVSEDLKREKYEWMGLNKKSGNSNGKKEIILN